MSKNSQDQIETIVSVWNRVADGYQTTDYDRPDNKANLQILLNCTGDPRKRGVLRSWLWLRNDQRNAS